MCGIYGTWNTTGGMISPETVQQFTTLIKHRGPDDEGYLLVNSRSSRITPCSGKDSKEDLNLPLIESLAADRYDLAFGFRRLSILDLSNAGHQPMGSPEGDLWIELNGEIYNYLELRAELIGYGYTFRSESDTEVVLCAYRQWGVDCLKRFNGMWSFAIWDDRQKALFLARDRFGIKPLYYTWQDGIFSFASEIKALVGKGGIPFSPRKQAVINYLACASLPAVQMGETFFEGVNIIPPGHWLLVRDGALKVERYWEMPEDHLDIQSSDIAVEQFRELLTDAIRIHLRSDVSVGTCLSGGLDSSSIVFIIDRLLHEGNIDDAQIGNRQRTFSAVYSQEGPFNERKYIDRVLDQIRASGCFTYPTADRLKADAERFVWHQEEPFPTTSMFAQWCVMRLVSENGVRVLLDGQGADEMLGGYRPYGVYLGELLRAGKIGRFISESRFISKNGSMPFLTALAQGGAMALPSGIKKELYRYIWQSAMKQSALSMEFREAVHPAAKSWSVHSTLDDHLKYIFCEENLPHLLRYEDRNSMAFSVESRVPYLDYRLVEYSYRTTQAWRINQGWTKWILRKAVENILPAEIVWRKDKVGFATPEGDWLKEWLRSDKGLLNDDARCKEYLNLEEARFRMDRWLNKGGERPPVWRWINLELWMRVWQCA